MITSKQIFLVPVDTNGPEFNKCIQVHENWHEKVELLEFTTQVHKQGFQQTSQDVLGHTDAHKAPTGETTSWNPTPPLNEMNPQLEFRG